MRTLLMIVGLAALGCNSPELTTVDDTSASAEASADGGSEGPEHSAESVAACTDKANGDDCAFTDAEGTAVTGACHACHDGVLACSAAGHGGGTHGGKH